MKRSGVRSSLLVWVAFFAATTGGRGDVVAEQLTITKLSPDMRVEARCGDYFGYDTIPGVTERRISFNYESDGNLFFRAVAYSTIRTELDDAKTAPTVEFNPTGEIIIRISEKDYEKEKACLPAPKQ